MKFFSPEDIKFIENFKDKDKLNYTNIMNNINENSIKQLISNPFNIFIFIINFQIILKKILFQLMKNFLIHLKILFLMFIILN